VPAPAHLPHVDAREAAARPLRSVGRQLRQRSQAPNAAAGIMPSMPSVEPKFGTSARRLNAPPPVMTVWTSTTTTPSRCGPKHTSAPMPIHVTARSPSAPTTLGEEPPVMQRAPRGMTRAHSGQRASSVNSP